jgi:Tfp pilus assembly protein PilO
MQALKLSEREKKLVLVTIGVLIFYVFYYFMFLPKWNEIDKLKRNVQDARIKLEIAEGKIRILEAFETRIGLRNVKLPESKEERALEILRALSEATSKSNLNMTSIRPDFTAREGIGFELISTGSYNNLYKFLRILREMKMLISIDELNINGEESRKPILGIKMIITAHY